MKSILTLIFLSVAVLVAGQTDSTQILIGALKSVATMPYICERLDKSDCGDMAFWKVVERKAAIIPYLLASIGDSTETAANVPNFGGHYTVGDICYTALEEIIHGIPTFDIAGVKFDAEGCGYCSFWLYIRQPKNRELFKKGLKKWYDANKQNLEWVVSNDFEVCDCGGIHPNGGHYQLKK